MYVPECYGVVSIAPSDRSATGHTLWYAAANTWTEGLSVVVEYAALDCEPHLESVRPVVGLEEGDSGRVSLARVAQTSFTFVLRSSSTGSSSACEAEAAATESELESPEDDQGTNPASPASPAACRVGFDVQLQGSCPSGVAVHPAVHCPEHDHGLAPRLRYPPPPVGSTSDDAEPASKHASCPLRISYRDAAHAAGFIAPRITLSRWIAGSLVCLRWATGSCEPGPALETERASHVQSDPGQMCFRLVGATAPRTHLLRDNTFAFRARLPSGCSQLRPPTATCPGVEGGMEGNVSTLSLPPSPSPLSTSPSPLPPSPLSVKLPTSGFYGSSSPPSPPLAVRITAEPQPDRLSDAPPLAVVAPSATASRPTISEPLSLSDSQPAGPSALLNPSGIFSAHPRPPPPPRPHPSAESHMESHRVAPFRPHPATPAARSPALRSAAVPGALGASGGHATSAPAPPTAFISVTAARTAVPQAKAKAHDDGAVDETTRSVVRPVTSEPDGGRDRVTGGVPLRGSGFGGGVQAGQSARAGHVPSGSVHLARVLTFVTSLAATIALCGALLLAWSSWAAARRKGCSGCCVARLARYAPLRLGGAEQGGDWGDEAPEGVLGMEVEVWEPASEALGDDDGRIGGEGVKAAADGRSDRGRRLDGRRTKRADALTGPLPSLSKIKMASGAGARATHTTTTAAGPPRPAGQPSTAAARRTQQEPSIAKSGRVAAGETGETVDETTKPVRETIKPLVIGEEADGRSGVEQPATPLASMLASVSPTKPATQQLAIQRSPADVPPIKPPPLIAPRADALPIPTPPPVLPIPPPPREQHGDRPTISVTQDVDGIVLVPGGGHTQVYALEEEDAWSPKRLVEELPAWADLADSCINGGGSTGIFAAHHAHAHLARRASPACPPPLEINPKKAPRVSWSLM